MIGKYTLKKLLQLNTVEGLKNIARMAGISGYSKLKKDDLIELVSEGILNDDYLQECFLAAGDRNIKDLERAIKTQVVLEKHCFRYSYWLDLGLAAKEDDGEIHIPEEVEEKYTTIKAQQSYQKAKKRFGIIDSYALACTNLYSIIEIEKFMDIINSQNKPEFDIKEAIYWFVLRGIYRGAEMYFYEDGYIMEDCYVDSFDEMDDYRHMLSKQDNKPYYVPPKGELLRYADSLYVERNTCFNNMLAFMKNSMGMDHEHAFDCCADMQLNIRYGDMPSQVMYELDRVGVVFESKLQMQAFAVHLMDMFNNTRIQENRGYTPNELKSIMQRKGSVSPKGPSKIVSLPYAAHEAADVTNDVPEPKEKINFGKIGRNEPCPCGSGKKYKNCCGKNR